MLSRAVSYIKESLRFSAYYWSVIARFYFFGSNEESENSDIAHPTTHQLSFSEN
jgi:hypothetical protein